ncbi:23S rRNA (uracil(1939)-C(5))-methyltransferase RlmD [Desulfocurvus sp. DL9XJH121]
MSELFHKGQELDLAIEKMASGGRGLGRVDGAVVFVDGALPGQRVRARVTKAAKRFAEADCVEVLEQSPHWTAPFCPHFGTCGGCAFQDLDYAQQLAWKTEHVRDQLARIGKVADPVVRPCAASPETRGFRNKMEFAFAGGGADRPLALGLHRRGSASIVSVEQCALMPLGGSADAPGEAMAMLREIREFCRGTGIPAWDPRTNQGLWRFVVLRQSQGGQQALAQIITSPRADGGAVRSLAEALHRSFPRLVSVAHSTRKDRTAVAQGEKTVFATGGGGITEILGGLTYRISPDAFFQTNTAAAELLYAAAREACELTGQEHVLDLYCGSGGLALAVAAGANTVTGVESVKAAVADAKANAKANRIANCRFKTADVLEFLKDPKLVADVVLVDPPRSGLHPGAAAELLRLAPKRIVYVSCNPATLARDVELLAPGYALAEARPFDLFPHSPHIECVALLKGLK